MKDQANQIKPKEVQTATLSGKQVKNKLNFFKSQAFLKDCPAFRAFHKEDILEEEELAINTHFQKDGEVFRLRIFIDDATNGSYKKLVFYKEDADGFPLMIKTPLEKSTNPTDSYIKSFLNGSEILHISKDLRLELKDGRSLTVTEENGEIIKLNSEQDNCLFEK